MARNPSQRIDRQSVENFVSSALLVIAVLIAVLGGVKHGLQATRSVLTAGTAGDVE